MKKTVFFGALTVAGLAAGISAGAQSEHIHQEIFLGTGYKNPIKIHKKSPKSYDFRLRLGTATTECMFKCLSLKNSLRLEADDSLRAQIAQGPYHKPTNTFKLPQVIRD